MADASAPAAAPSASEAVCAFRKPASRARGNARKRPRLADDDAAAAADAAPLPSAVRSSAPARPAGGPFVQSTARPRATASAIDVVGAQASDRRITTYDNHVFATNEQETSRDRDAQSIFERAKALDAAAAPDTTASGEKLYRGANNYRTYTERPANFDAAVIGGRGPQRAPVHFRAISRFDYQPDVCKDYKETGFCGYGDACKFLHDRGDYKTGWQLERDWDAQQKAKQQRLEQAVARAAGGGAEGEGEAGAEGEGGAGGAGEEELPFACLICRTPWTAKSDPVVTKCGHHFCEACALAHLATSTRCAVCNEQTHGTLNAAKRLREVIRARAARSAAGAATAAADDAEAEAEVDDDAAAVRQARRAGRAR